MKISIKIVGIISFIYLLVTGISGYMIFLEQSKVIEKKIQDQLESVSVLKRSQLNQFFIEEAGDLESIAEDLFFLELYNEMVHVHDALRNKGLPEYESHDLSLHDEMRHILGKKVESLGRDFKELFIINNYDLVEVSTKKEHEGKIKSSEGYFIEGKKRTYIQSFYYDLTQQEPTITISTPVKNEDQETIGVLVAIIDPEEINKIMTERSGLGETGETILVNKFNLLVSKSRFIEGIEFKKVIHAQVVKNCLNEESGYSQYEDYRDIQALVNYKWMPELKVCLITKIDASEGLKPINKLRTTIILIDIGVIMIGILLGLLLSRAITNPLEKLVKGTNELAKSNFNHRIKIKTNDELEILGKSFNKTAEQLKQAHDKERIYQKSLEREVKKKTKELENKLSELEKFQKISVGRELKMVELKKKVKELENIKERKYEE